VFIGSRDGLAGLAAAVLAGAGDLGAELDFDGAGDAVAARSFW
jgi:hypothetical protein